MTEVGLFQGIRFYLKKRGEAVFVAWLLYLGIDLLLWALTWPIEFCLARTINAALDFIPGSHLIAEPGTIWPFIATSAAWGTIALSIGTGLGLWRLHREHRWDAA
jgi:hypothetical protein